VSDHLTMRKTPVILALLTSLVATPVALAAGSGGATGPGPDGGAQYGAPLKKIPVRPIAVEFSVTPKSVRSGDTRPTITIRVKDPGITKVRARLALVRLEDKSPALSMELGRVAANRRVVIKWPARTPLPVGRFKARLHVTDGHGLTLLRRARTSGLTTLTVKAPVVTVGGQFPVQGAHNYGGADARFGAPRNGHTHQGQDVLAAEGTPVVTPVAGTVTNKSYQASGAGYYLVVHGADNRDYAFMHCQQDSIPVEIGAVLTQGQQICLVGHTGDATGPHLHFEIWVGGWWAKGGYPIDPLPDLKAWDTSGSANAPQ
jgi:murein DD-endopeptidase MepM/ murein hydrolase activator NlpD